MRKFSASFTALTVFFLCIEPLYSYGAPVAPDEQFVLARPTTSEQDFYGYTKAYIDESYALGSWSSLVGLKWENNDYSKKQTSGEVCSSIEAENCKNVTDFRYDAVFDVCSEVVLTNCILQVWASVENQPYIKGRMAERTSRNYEFTFAGSPSKGVPNGSTPSLWEFQGVNHEGGSQFLVSVTASKGAVGTGSLRPTGMIAAIQPVSKLRGNFYLPRVTGLREPSSVGVVWGIDAGKIGACVRVLSNSECALPWPHPNKIKYKLEIRVAKNLDLTNFLHGRITKPSASLDSISSSDNLLTVEAEPIQTPFINAWKKNSDISPELSAILDKLFYLGGGYEGRCDGTRAGCNFEIGPIQLNDAGIKQYKLWLKEFSDRATGVKSMWSVRTLDSHALYSTYGSDECVRKTSNIAGIVSTNANVYEGGPPRFSVRTQTLDYQVASPHFDSGGRVNSGSYDFVLDADVARCLYGFTNAPLRAELSVFGEQGEKKVATTVVGEKNGQLYFSAIGFEYSVPTLKVKLFQEKVETKPLVVPIPQTTIQKKQQITCTKGKVTKKVSGTNPKCPTGYKKK